MQPLLFNIKNTTDKPQMASIFNTLDVGYGTNLYPSYQWDLTAALADAALFNSNVLTIIAASAQPGAPYELFTYVSPSTFTTAAQVIAALNSLGIGTFTSAGGNLVNQTVKTNYSFSSINITNNYIAQPANSPDYSLYGSLIYNAGYSSNGVGSFTQISTSNALWINPGDNFSGPGNRLSVWNNSIPSFPSQQVGLYTQFQSDVDKTAYIGICADDKATIYFNNKLILDYDVAAMSANVGSVLGPVYDDGKTAFRFFNIYPIQIKSGNNLLQAQNINIFGDGAIGVQIYDMTAAQIAAATDLGDLNAIFSSYEYVGEDLF